MYFGYNKIEEIIEMKYGLCLKKMFLPDVY